MNTDGLRGFTTLRTRPLVPMSEQPEPARHCTKCGARLRRSNPGPTCARVECCGMRCEELTDCELVLVESTERGAEVVARMRGFYESEAAHNAKPKRNAQIADFIGRGFTQAEVGAMFGISQNRVCEVMRGK